MDKVYTTVEQIIRMYLLKIANGNLLEGDKMLSEDNLAKVLGLSRSTCRKAMLQLESMGILSGKRGKVRVVAKDAKKLVPLYYENLSYGYGGKKIALVLLDDRQYFASISREAHERSSLFNWALTVFYNSNLRQEYKNFEKIAEDRYDGCIIVPLKSGGEYVYDNYKILQKAQIPFVLLERPPRTLSCDALFANDYMGSYSMTKHLLKNGARAVAYVTGKNMNFFVNLDRQTGYEDALRRLGKQSIVFDAGDVNFKNDFTDFLRSAPDKIGINMYSDDLAERVLACLNSAGKVRGVNYEILCWAEREETADDSGKQYKLVRVPKEEIIDRAFELLLQRISYGVKGSSIHEIFEVKIPK